MKLPTHLLSLVLAPAAGLAQSGPFLATNDKPPVTAHPVTFQMQHVELAANDASSILRKLVATGSTADARAAVDQLVAANKATITHDTQMSSVVGSKSRSAGIIEWIYPTEYDPAEVPNHVGIVSKSSLPKTVVTPTAYETRDVGTVAEFSADAIVDGIVHFQSESSLVDIIGGRSHSFNDSREFMPRFHSHTNAREHLSIPANQWALVRTTSSPPPSTQMTMTWMRAVPVAEPLSLGGPSPIDPNIAFLVEWFELPAEKTGELAPPASADAHATAYETAQHLVEQNEGRRLATVMMLTTAGGIGQSGSGEEFIYPTEMDPPELPNTIVGVIGNGAGLGTHSSPTAFETRNLGALVECQHNLTLNGDMIWTRIAAARTLHDFDIMHGAGLAQLNMPLFRVESVQTTCVLKSGKPHLLGMTTAPFRTHPKPSVMQAVDQEDPPHYQTGNVPRTVIFVTATILVEGSDGEAEH